MSEWERALAPVVAWGLKMVLGILLTLGTIVVVYQFVPREVQVWAFNLLDKYLPVISKIFK